MSQGDSKSKPGDAGKPTPGLSASDLRARLGLKTTSTSSKGSGSDLRAKLGIEPAPAPSPAAASPSPAKPNPAIEQSLLETLSQTEPRTARGASSPASQAAPAPSSPQETHALTMDEFEQMVVAEPVAAAKAAAAAGPSGIKVSGSAPLIKDEELDAVLGGFGAPGESIDLLSSSILIEDAPNELAASAAAPPAHAPPPVSSPRLPSLSPTPARMPAPSAAAIPIVRDVPPPTRQIPAPVIQESAAETRLLDAAAEEQEDFDAFPDGEKTQIMMSAVDYDPLTAKLVVESGEAPQRDYVLARDKTSIGRGTKNGVVIPDIAMSRSHFAVERYTEGFLLRDLESGNGTMLNGRRIVYGELRNKDIIEAGNLRFRFEQSGGDPEKVWKGEPKIEYHAKDAGPTKAAPTLTGSNPVKAPAAKAQPTAATVPSPAVPPQPQTLIQQPMMAQWSNPNMMAQGYRGMQPGWNPAMMAPAYASYTQQGIQMMMAQQQQQRRKGSPVITALIVFFSILLVGLVGLILWSLVQHDPKAEVNEKAVEEQKQAQARAFVTEGSSHFEARRWADALRAFQEALKLDPKNQTALMFVNEVIPREQAVGDEIKRVLQNARQDPGATSYELALESLSKVSADSVFANEVRTQHIPDVKKNYRKRLIIEAKKAMNSGNYDKAIQDLDKIEVDLGFANDPDVTELRKQIADLRKVTTTAPTPAPK